MRELIHNFPQLLAEFETWFDLRFGWFFTNGMKERSAERSEPDTPAQESASSTS